MVLFIVCRILAHTNKDSMKLSELILEKAYVAVVPGIAFGMEGHLRISYSGNSEEIIEALVSD